MFVVYPIYGDPMTHVRHARCNLFIYKYKHLSIYLSYVISLPYGNTWLDLAWTYRESQKQQHWYIRIFLISVSVEADWNCLSLIIKNHFIEKIIILQNVHEFVMTKVSKHITFIKYSYVIKVNFKFFMFPYLACPV